MRTIDLSAHPLGNPQGLALDGQGNLYSASAGVDSVVDKYDAQGRYVARLGGLGTADGQFNFTSLPGGDGIQQGFVATDRRGNLYVADTYNHRIQKFSPDG